MNYKSHLNIMICIMINHFETVINFRFLNLSNFETVINFRFLNLSNFIFMNFIVYYYRNLYMIN